MLAVQSKKNKITTRCTANKSYNTSKTDPLSQKI